MEDRGITASDGTGLPRSEWLQVHLSVDGGESLEPALKITDFQSPVHLPSIGTKGGGLFASMAADPSGKHKDRLYVVWAEARDGRSQIRFSYSSDRGKTWSPPTSINDDQKSDRPSGGPNDFMPTVATNKDGVVGVMWYDRRDNPDNKGYYARFTASLDGGETWLPSVRVSEAPNSLPQKMPPGAHFSFTGGDTAGLAADNQGVFHALWIDDRTGVQQVWTAAIRVNEKSGN